MSSWDSVLKLVGPSFAAVVFYYLWTRSQSNQTLNGSNAVGEKILKSIIKERSLPSMTFDEYELAMAANIVDPKSLSLTFDDIGGLADAKESLQEAVILPLERPELFESSLLRMPKGILLYGPPGTGKTMLAKAIAKESGAVFINIPTSSILNKWFGETNKLVAALFNLANKLSPAIIFIDEIDSLFRSRGASQEHEHLVQMKCEFMSHWDGLLTGENSRVVVIGATNRPQDLDSAIMRRMPLSLHVGLPTIGQRTNILSLILKDEKMEPDCTIEKIAKITEGFSGSDLKELCRMAAQIVLKDYLRTERSASSSNLKRSNNNNNSANNSGASSPALKPRMRFLRMSDFETAKANVKSASTWSSEDSSSFDMVQFFKALQANSQGNLNNNNNNGGHDAD